MVVGHGGGGGDYDEADKTRPVHLKSGQYRTWESLKSGNMCKGV